MAWDTLRREMPDEPRPFEGVLDFWFGELDARGCAAPGQRALWFRAVPDFDRRIIERFSGLHAELARGGRKEWLASPHGRLASIIVLDQFSRNMFRNAGEMFACDGRALELALDGIERGEDRTLGYDERSFFYLPLMHSEKLAVQERCVDFFATLCDEQQNDAELLELASDALSYAQRHRDIIRQFSRFPHRNAILGRLSTPEETEFLKQPNSSF
jgi:uncharacterized protein (DUF924 family)